MLSKAFEWSRVTNANPDDDFIAKRSVVVRKLADELPKKSQQLVDLACGAAGGVVPRFAQDSELVIMLVDAIRKEQPAFPQALAENHLDLRVVCALVVGEIAERANAGKGAPSGASQLSASVVASGLANRPITSPKHLAAMTSELVAVCLGTLKRSAELRRRRMSVATGVEQIGDHPDLPAFWKDAKPHFLRMVHAVEANAAMDREEIDTLWWAFNGVSRTTGRSFAEMSVGEAALCAGFELAALVLPVPLPNTKLLTDRVIALGRKPAELQDRTVREVIAEWKTDVAAALVPSEDKTLDFVRANPTIFPVTWTCQRIEESRAPSASELKKATGWDAAHKVPPRLISSQAFDEKILQRLYQDAFAG